MANFYAKRAYDVVDAQRDGGGVTETAPFVGISDAGLGGESGPIGWDSVLLPLQLYLFDYYGDARVMNASYAASAQWMEFLLQAPESSVEGGLSDWMGTEHSPNALTGRAFLWLNLWSWARVNALLGHADVAAEFAAKVRACVVCVCACVRVCCACACALPMCVATTQSMSSQRAECYVPMSLVRRFVVVSALSTLRPPQLLLR